MAIEVLKDAVVTINAVDLTDHIMTVKLDYGVDAVEKTAMGDVVHRFMPGLKVVGFEATFFQDTAASSVDATLFPLVGAAAFAVAVKRTSGAISATNPEYQMNMILVSYPILDGSVGSDGTVSVSFATDTDITRDVTP